MHEVREFFRCSEVVDCRVLSIEHIVTPADHCSIIKVGEEQVLDRCIASVV